MEHITLTDAKAHLSDIIDRVERGETVAITRRGKVAARISPSLPEKTKIDIAMLDELHALIPMQEESAGEFVRRMRDSGY